MVRIINFLVKKEPSLRAGFEPARGDPIGFRVQRLNHSAIAAAIGGSLQNPFNIKAAYFALVVLILKSL